MAAGSLSANTLMIRKLESLFSLTEEERQALQDLPVQIKTLKDNQDIVRLGDRPSHCCLLLEGFTCLYKLNSEGKRQIMALHIPGDIPDLQSLHLGILDNSIATLSPCTIGLIRHEDLLDVCVRYPRITSALWRETLVDSSALREWLLNVGQRESYSRLAHLLGEILIRLKAVGLVKDSAFLLPITQAELADAIGISPVHANRIFQALRADGLIQTEGRLVTIPDWDKLKEAGEFDPLYLHLREIGVVSEALQDRDGRAQG